MVGKVAAVSWYEVTKALGCASSGNWPCWVVSIFGRLCGSAWVSVGKLKIC